MSRGPATFKQGDLDRAISVAQKRGLTDYEIIIEGPRVILRVSSIPLSPNNKPIAEQEGIVL